MHDFSLPPGDRVAAEGPMPAPPNPLTHGLKAFAITVNGRYFRGWRRGRQPLTVLSIRRARMFMRQEAAVTELAKLRRSGVQQCNLVPLLLTVKS